MATRCDKEQVVTEKYRGFTLSAKRSAAMGGWVNTYFYVVRDNDGWLLTDSFTEGTDTPKEMIGYLKEQVDDYYEHPGDYEED